MTSKAIKISVILEKGKIYFKISEVAPTYRTQRSFLGLESETHHAGQNLLSRILTPNFQQVFWKLQVIIKSKIIEQIS